MIYEDRPDASDAVARALWDMFSTIKRLDSLEYNRDMEIWIAHHSTGDVSFYDPEDGDIYNRSGKLRLTAE